MKKLCIAAALCAISFGARAALPLYDAVAARIAPHGGCVVTDGRVLAVTQAHYMVVSLMSGDKERFQGALSCMRDKLQGGAPAALPAALYGPDPGDNDREKVLDGTRPTEASVLMAWSLLEAGRAFGGGYERQGRAMLASIKAQAVQDSALGQVLAPQVPLGEDGSAALAPASVPPFALRRLCLEDAGFCAIGSDSLRALSRGAGQGYVPDRITFTKDGLLAVYPSTAGTDEAARFWHYLALTNKGDPDRALLLSALGRLSARLDEELRPPRLELMHPRTEEGMGSDAQDASAALIGPYKSRWFLGAASASLLKAEDDPLAQMIMLESLWLQDRRVELDRNGCLKEGKR